MGVRHLGSVARIVEHREIVVPHAVDELRNGGKNRGSGCLLGLQHPDVLLREIEATDEKLLQEFDVIVATQGFVQIWLPDPATWMLVDAATDLDADQKGVPLMNHHVPLSPSSLGQLVFPRFIYIMPPTVTTGALSESAIGQQKRTSEVGHTADGEIAGSLALCDAPPLQGSFIASSIGGQT